MKKSLFISLLIGAIIMPQLLVAQSTVAEGQSTEGKDFWVTFMQADQDSNNPLIQSLSISSRYDCSVTISNPYTDYVEADIPITANEQQLIQIYNGTVMADGARNSQAQTGKVCYAVRSEIVDTCALHITATEDISLFATSYKQATFDATNVIPTTSLLDQYVIVTYTPSDHDGVSESQGSHFAIIATEDNTIVDFCPTVQTQGMVSGRYGSTFPQVGDTLTTPELMKGQVYYVWTGKKDGEVGDLTGTWIKARDGKKIAVFQGCPHTNIPYQKKERDHIFSQAMPVQYWGNTFVLTASKDRKRDIYRIEALNDETTIHINGDSVYTFNFNGASENDRKHYYEFELGSSISNSRSGIKVIDGTSCIVTTSCPCAVHQFIASRKYDDVSNGDPAMLWINPIEQQIDQITFATYASTNSKKSAYSYHYVNIVTAEPQTMELNGVSIASDFSPVTGSSIYYYARHQLDNTSTADGSEGNSYTLKNTNGNFIAHVYGFTQNESYGFSAGGATKPLTQYITINGKIFTPDSDNSLCGDDTVKFACHPDYEYEKIVWGFGDGQIDDTNKDSVNHYYDPGVYQAYCLIYRSSSNVCKGQSLMDSIPIRVTIGNYKIGVINTHMPSCTQKGDDNVKYTIYLSNPGRVSLTGDSVSLTFDDVAKAAGFLPSMLHITDDSLVIDVPHGAEDHTEYGLKLRIGSECPNSVLDTMLSFKLEFYRNYMEQRFANVIGVMKDSFPNQILTDFEWKQVDENNNLIAVLQDQKSSVLELAQAPQAKTWYIVCFKIRDTWQSTPTNTCSCPIPLDPAYNDQLKAQPNSEALLIGQNVAHMGDQVFVNALEDGTATWYGPDGNEYATANLPKGGGLVKAPDKPGLFILKVDAGHQRTFKFLVFSK